MAAGDLAIAAKLSDDNPNLLQLRLFRVLEAKAGNTVVVLPPEGVVGLKELMKKSAKPD